MKIFEQDLPKTRANYTSITPLSYIQRSAEVYPEKLAVVHGIGSSCIRYSWKEFYGRSRRLASALKNSGVETGDTVAVMLPNTPPMLDAHFGVPMAGAVLNAINTRLDAESVAYILDHGEAKVLIVDSEFGRLVRNALSLRKSKDEIKIINAVDPFYHGTSELLSDIEYEDYLNSGDPTFSWEPPSDEWDAIALNYTSGTTGKPKGVVYHHRGAALAALSTVLEWDIEKHPVYLWTLPMFHCNGWCFPWTVAARAGVNVCLRKVEAQAIFSFMAEHAVTHYCGAPIVHNMLINAQAELKQSLTKNIKAMVAGAAPPVSMIQGMEQMGFDLLHVYGLTEVYGPASVCAKLEAWKDLEIEERARLNARQGVAYHLEQGLAVMNPLTMEPVPADGDTIGEIMFRGNMTMKGYLKDAKATEEALQSGWFHTGDLGVMEPDGYIRVKDRTKDIIISGGENISSIEIEDVLYRHPAVLCAAVIAKPDAQWGEVPCAFIEVKPGIQVDAAEIVQHCRNYIAGFKIPKMVVFGELPKTSTGKIQKFSLRQSLEHDAGNDRSSETQ